MAKGVWVKILKYNQSSMKEHLLDLRHGMGEDHEFDEKDAGSIIFVELVHSEFRSTSTCRVTRKRLKSFVGSFLWHTACSGLPSHRKA